MFNQIKTFTSMAVITVLFIVVGGMIDRCSGMILVLLFTPGISFFSYWSSDKMVLRVYSAQGVSETSVPQFYRMVQEPASCAGLPTPRVYLIDKTQPNAFATGRNPEHATVATATGVLNILSERELYDVMTRGSAHVQHRDILISTILMIMAGAISTLTNSVVFFGGHDSGGRPTSPIAGIAVAILAPLTASLIQMAVSHARRFEADHGGATISDGPQAPALTLNKIHRYAANIPLTTAEAHPTTTQMMIMNPLHGGGLANLFSMHPATGERTTRLVQIAQMGQYLA